MSGNNTDVVINESNRSLCNVRSNRPTEQMIRFFAGTALTLLCSRMIHRTMNNLKCMFYRNILC